MYKWKKHDNYSLTMNQMLDFKSVCVFSAYKKYDHTRQDFRFQVLFNESGGKDSQAAEENRKPG